QWVRRASIGPSGPSPSVSPCDIPHLDHPGWGPAKARAEAAPHIKRSSMMRRFATVLSSALLAGALASMGCPGGGGLPGGSNLPGGASNAGSVDPNSCGDYASSDVGAKLKGFLEASVQL